ERFGYDLGLVGAEEDDVAIDRTNAIKNDIEVGFRNVLDDRRLQAFNALGAFVDLDISQALGTVDTYELGVIVDLLARHACATRHAQCGNTALGIIGRAAKHLEFDLLKLIGNVDQ